MTDKDTFPGWVALVVNETGARLVVPFGDTGQRFSDPLGITIPESRANGAQVGQAVTVRRERRDSGMYVFSVEEAK